MEEEVKAGMVALVATPTMLVAPVPEVGMVEGTITIPVVSTCCAFSFPTTKLT